jgi:hypothetical protein
MFSRWFILLLLPLVVCGSTSSSTAQLSLDLSYLHSCPSDDLAVAIRETLTQQQQQEPIVDIDLTASLIGKNISGILESLKPFDNKNEGSPLQNPPLQTTTTTTTTTTTFVRLTARRNQWSSEDAIQILNFVLENSPNETITNESSVEEKDDDDSDNAGAAVVTTTETDDNNNITIDKNEEEEEDATKTDGKIHTGNNNKPPLAFVSIQSLDLGWNNLGRVSGSRSASSGVKTMNKALRRLLSDSRQCPPSIRLNVCGLGPSSCRDIAKGIVERYDIKQGSDVDKEGKEENGHLFCPPPLSLDLARNEGIGDAGVAALAAAIRTVASQQQRKENNIQKKKKMESIKKLDDDENKDNDVETDSASSSTTTEEDDDDLSEAFDSLTKTNTIIFERLDLSGCKIGDVGAEALAIALENHPLCVKYLDLSNNQISDEGAIRIARALGGIIDNRDDHHSRPRSNSGFVETLDLSNNNDLSDRGAKELARAFQEDGISNLILRSCNIKADGAAYFGNALRLVASQANAISSSVSVSVSAEGATRRRRSIDLSGNPLGILTKKKSSGNKYSAKALRSKATATTSAYMNIIGKKIRGLSENINGEGLDTLESDDEEEDRMGDDDNDDSKTKCGALSFAEAFIDDGEYRAEESGVKSENNDDIIEHFELGLRHCSFDTRAAEALAAVLQESRQKYPRIKLTMDMTMNNVLEEDIIDALNGGLGYNDQLADMADSYLDALEILREARERALKATRIAAARAKADAERESDWGSPPPGSRSRHSRDDGLYRDDDEWDSVSDFDPSEEGSDDEYSW